ncbi:uncharacterized protein EDB93DRAFT_1237498 [Suillus bovinus]|uniref:uncharacterized protein n=1 Tax=Suillus bovinus TaxID=48563 RepID=UPI001B85C939|nr:uncharacterized protein EDB93DRAFT_1237498 [Suillus bovinus]KAG2159301.1 hypothetical protein EDB93DRAFT_1237498 [Suillus bovinus]
MALEAIEKLLKSKKTNFVSDGLQAKWARTIQSHLALIVKRGHSSIEASERAAESHGFAAAWSGRQLCSCTHNWVSKRELPQSLTGRHAKVYSLLDDPAVAAELRTYVRSNKWAINPEKLAEFSKSKLIPSEAEKYLHTIVNDEMPRGLKQYMELELFPRIHLKIGRGISLVTARWWLLEKFKLRKKGVDHGLHRSDVICSTVGHLVDAGESMEEYSKNHEGYWNGEMFVKQLNEKIIPTFEHIHGPGYQALFLIDNSQGHSAYAEDALLVSHMNINPAGKQAHMRNGWFMCDGIRVEQDMVFPPDHPQFPNEPKGVKKYLRDNCDGTFETLKKNMPLAMQSVQLRAIRLWEHHMHRWMEAYWTGLGMKDAQFRVKQFSSTKYKSHRCVHEAVACTFD